MKFVFNLMLNAFSMSASIAISYRSLARLCALEGAAVCTWEYDILGVALVYRAPNPRETFCSWCYKSIFLMKNYKQKINMSQRGNQNMSSDWLIFNTSSRIKDCCCDVQRRNTP
jgi:hypothetical protein